MITSAREFIKLRYSEDPKEYLRAANEPADEAVWWELIQQHPDTAKWVAHNKTIPEQIIRYLAKHHDANVRHVIASKRKTPKEVLMMLAQDGDDSVRLAVAMNVKTPTDVLEVLSHDSWTRVSSAAKDRLSKL